MTRAGTARFQTLDAFRGIAALSVTLFHCVNSHPEVASSAIGRWLLYGWAGVFLFFPISGYCICAALDQPHNSRVTRFAWRRWRRIFPPYWASVLLATGVALAALPFNRGSMADVALSPERWLSVLTLTQVFTAFPEIVNPVYWSLGYEVQFYAVMTCVLLVPRDRGPMAVGALSCLAAVYLMSPGLEVRGLFLNHWLSFAAGCAVHMWLHRPAARPIALVVAACAVAAAIARTDPGLAVSVAAGIVMIVAASIDARAATWRVLIPMLALGQISYSLYLTHVPIGGRVVNLLVRFDAPVWLAGGLAAAPSVAAATAFYWVVERRDRAAREELNELEPRYAVVTAMRGMKRRLMPSL